MTRKIRVGLLFGGRSGEHEVSIASASSVLNALDREKYEPVLIGITRQGQWLMTDSTEQLPAGEVTPELPDTSEAMPDVTRQSIVRVSSANGFVRNESVVDVVFPVMHGPRGEDGSIQGLLETASIPYVGSGVLGSAVSMDKAMMKSVLIQGGLPSVPHRLVNAHEWQKDRHQTLREIEAELTYPMFVKPCNLGSSVGISKVRDRDQLQQSLALALRYDRRVIVEQGVDAREVECSVLGNEDPIVSVPGEIVSQNEWYDYEAKYHDGLAELIIPARISSEQSRTVHDYALRAFRAVDAAGLARVDFFIRRSDGAVIVNEINTIPGFTQLSMYPKLWEASGLSYAEVVDRLIQLAFERHEEKARLSVER